MSKEDIRQLALQEQVNELCYLFPHAHHGSIREFAEDWLTYIERISNIATKEWIETMKAPSKPKGKPKGKPKPKGGKSGY